MPRRRLNFGSKPNFREGSSGSDPMDFFGNMLLGFQVALQPANLFFCFLGVLIGTLVGVLPGLGPVAAMSLLLPSTFHVSPVSAIIMLAGIYYGAMYGGSTTSILVNIPGEAAPKRLRRNEKTPHPLVISPALNSRMKKALYQYQSTPCSPFKVCTFLPPLCPFTRHLFLPVFPYPKKFKNDFHQYSGRESNL